MTLVLPPEEKAERLNRLLTVWLLRLAALALFGLGLSYWIRLVGIYDGPLWRFDTMPVWWKIAAPALAVLYPVAGVGLWMTVSWGAVTWAIVALVEMIMHLAFPDLFGGMTILVFLHLFGLGLLGLLRLTSWWELRQRLRRRG
jgi:hypothetical protein